MCPQIKSQGRDGIGSLSERIAMLGQPGIHSSRPVDQALCLPDQQECVGPVTLIAAGQKVMRGKDIGEQVGCIGQNTGLLLQRDVFVGNGRDRLDVCNAVSEQSDFAGQLIAAHPCLCEFRINGTPLPVHVSVAVERREVLSSGITIKQLALPFGIA